MTTQTKLLLSKIGSSLKEAFHIVFILNLVLIFVACLAEIVNKSEYLAVWGVITFLVYCAFGKHLPDGWYKSNK